MTNGAFHSWHNPFHKHGSHDIYRFQQDAMASADSLNGPAVRVAGYSTSPSYPTLPHDYSVSTERFPEAHPATGLVRESSGATIPRPEHRDPSSLEHADFPVPFPAGGRVYGAGDTESLRPLASTGGQLAGSQRISPNGEGVPPLRLNTIR